MKEILRLKPNVKKAHIRHIIARDLATFFDLGYNSVTDSLILSA